MGPVPGGQLTVRKNTESLFFLLKGPVTFFLSLTTMRAATWLFCLRATARMLDVRYHVCILWGPGVMGSARGLGRDSGVRTRVVVLLGESSGLWRRQWGSVSEGRRRVGHRLALSPHGHRAQGAGTWAWWCCFVPMLWSPIGLLYSGLPTFQPDGCQGGGSSSSALLRAQSSSPCPA